MQRKIFAIILSVVMLILLIPSAYAASDEAVGAANALYELGLFNGTGTDSYGKPIFDLDRAPTRHEAVTMLVRLLGKEGEAKNGTWTTPFTDVADWAKPYVGYAYTHGLTTGTSATTYSGNDAVTATQYLTFVLRALGYNDNEGDFLWDEAWVLSDKIGMTHGQYSATTAFTRGDIASISYSALGQKSKNADVSLVQYLYLCNAVSSGTVLSQFLTSYGGLAYYREYLGLPRVENINLRAVQEKSTAIPGAIYFTYRYPFNNEYESEETCRLYRHLLESQGFAVEVDTVSYFSDTTYIATVPTTGKTFTFGAYEFIQGEEWVFYITIPIDDVTICDDTYDTSYYLSENEINLTRGQSTTITATISPASSTASVEWDVSDSDIISVSTISKTTSNGNTVITARITALQSGYALIFAWLTDEQNSCNNTLALCNVTVSETISPSPVKITNIRAKMDSVGGWTFTFDFENRGDKTIKYATPYWYCLNAVGDRVYDRISLSDRFSGRITGPIAPGEKLTDLQNERKFYNSSFDNSIQFIEIVVEYMDGSVEVVSPDKYYDYWDLD